MKCHLPLKCWHLTSQGVSFTRGPYISDMIRHLTWTWVWRAVLYALVGGYIWQFTRNRSALKQLHDNHLSVPWRPPRVWRADNQTAISVVPPRQQQLWYGLRLNLVKLQFTWHIPTWHTNQSFPCLAGRTGLTWLEPGSPEPITNTALSLSKTPAVIRSEVIFVIWPQVIGRYFKEQLFKDHRSPWQYSEELNGLL